LNLQRLCEEIRLPREAVEVLEAYRSMDEETYDGYRRAFHGNRVAFFEEITRDPRYRGLLLYLFLRFAVDAHERYRALGIGDDVYFDTFADIRIWCLNCARDYGEYGIEQYGWLQEHVQLRLFRLGRLQFQPCPIDRDVVVDGRTVFRGQIVLNVHIPEGEPLDTGLAEESFARAGTFFRGIEPVFMCHSWLLYPELADILPPDSNIAKFQRFFQIYDVDPSSREAEQRIFIRTSDDPSAYEARTTLQRSAKAYLESGRKLGSGSGISLGLLR
jgi:hypothetical protein